MQNIFSLLLIVTNAEYYGDYKFQIQNWNTGRLYVSENDPYFATPYGTVCSGVRHEKIENNKIFGDLICNKLGFVKSLFIGRRPEYTNFMSFPDIPDPTQNCQPEYGISGAVCESCVPGQPCTIYNVRQ